ncbi:MAG: class I SAM-dependent methyltransferase [Deltaproteobacteria bacterium]|nr:class I SAM-dependent methyltransferase [Deltaproteobacteria bacterium]
MDACPHPRATARLLFPARDYVSGDAFEVCACAACGLAVTLPQPAPPEMGRYYPPAYYGSAGARRFPGPVEWLQRRLYGSRARAVEALAGGRPGRVLDVGCGPGWLLDAFRRRGWEPVGTELSEASAARARALGLPVHVGPLESWPWPEGHFDAVTLWHVLEHWPDPRLPIERLARLLRPGGVLLVGVPDFGSPEARLARAGWFHLDVPRHLVHLTPASLGQLLSREGLAVRRTSTFAPEYDAFSLLQSALNRLGLRHNLLYDLLRGRGAKLGAGAAGSAGAALTLLLAIPLAALAVPLSLAISLGGRGSSLSLYATREAPGAGGGA